MYIHSVASAAQKFLLDFILCMHTFLHEYIYSTESMRRSFSEECLQKSTDREFLRRRLQPIN